MAARTARLDVRLTAGEAARLREVSASLGCSQADVVRLALQYAERCPEAAASGAPVVFDRASTLALARNLRAVGTLYNQSVRSLNALAKGMREGLLDAPDAAPALEAVHVDMAAVLAGLDDLRRELAQIHERQALFLW